MKWIVKERSQRVSWEGRKEGKEEDDFAFATNLRTFTL